MRIIGLTGSIGMGKSAVSAWLESRGEKVVDTDLLARSLVEKGQPALDEITAEFGAGVLNFDGTLDRKALAARVFSDGAARASLEAILHPRIREEWLERIRRWESGGERRCFVVIPLLFETGAEDSVDRIICVACGTVTQKRRLKDRGWSGQEIQNRLASQWQIAHKLDRSDYVIWNESSLEICHRQTARILGVNFPPEALV